MPYENFVNQVPHPMPGTLDFVIPHSIRSQHLFQDFKQNLPEGSDLARFDPHLNVTQSQDSQFMLKNLGPCGACHKELDGLAKLVGMVALHAQVEILHCPGMHCSKDIHKGLSGKPSSPHV
mmetsp:Transcript_7928/g.22715  ORF Transcript_7928/g.22715 Transcript_7928/m.22715 type:complete len:121 (+) Transcript_7928:3063-3425(+)